ncbi:tyrosine-type recombinase/integrase [Thiothrix lacustris]|uniref:Tyrosine-type recombinase/integrase n=1 Tax=Thiothrix lacustris TaxID=525917 RepID=A0ABY9MP31_9GAMM|nr:integrase arm-type DNA-binding domain-containing protein [Thiothrix lacustris]WML90127.1 tyrosine-type recombinase/integrase [Thiothrix lacustris]
MKSLLTDTAVKNAKPKDKPYNLTDGGGLYLKVATAGKYWRYNYSFNGKQKTLAIGVYPDTSLKQARDKHQAARELLAQGVDPSSHKQEAKAAERALTENSFELVAREWYGKFSGKWSKDHAANVLTRLEKDLFPFIGGKPVAEIEPPAILKCLRRIEERGALDSAHRAKTTAGQVFRYAVSIGKATRDPTPDLHGALPPPDRKHFAALTDPQEVGQLLRDIADYHGVPETVTALQLSAYLFQRPGEIRAMQWSEINFETAQWTIPAERMKRRKAHTVPLSKQVLALLDELRPMTGRRTHVFPSRTDINKPMGANTLGGALRKMGYDSDTMTAHGFRALASTMLYEMGYPADVIEKQLAHSVGNTIRQAYDRSQHLDQRTAMMQQWADYLDSLRGGAQVIPIRRAG